ncbi:beta-ketoacyl synthase N-terminal-like domain-containing protein [Aquimarina sp. I32.4]|uniref:beta-ketoacyl synthase N-terminal-like domain-containing protein n=1 Tax=Aquimarina sp. I32.4 TaxID=2053903 RepID=UPI000CDE7053|nr:beta-ketoacyl synthase N-terminal-like domain-containing protein [Aquimarina sp. I32.4]
MISSKNDVVTTGMGVITPIGIGVPAFSQSLRKGSTNFSKISFKKEGTLFEYPIAQVNDFNFKEEVTKINLEDELLTKVKQFRNISKSTEYGLYCALEAWKDAGLSKDIDLTRVAIVSGGSNTQQSSLDEVHNKYANRLQFLNPNYGFNFFDTDLVGVLSELFGVRGEGYSIGATSASGNMSIIQGSRLIKSNEYDVVIVVAPLMDLSIYEYQGFTNLGAMASVEEHLDFSKIYKPFDRKHNGFVYGQSAGCMILESKKHALEREKETYGTIAGYGVHMDANRNPNPSVEGEQQAIQWAMKSADITINEIDYVNTHGSGSIVGDKTEVAALLSLGLKGINANSTKSLIGHSLSSASMVEAIASLIQMKEGFLHKSNNLIEAINDDIDWVKDTSRIVNIDRTLSNSFGFGGINTAIILKNNK